MTGTLKDREPSWQVVRRTFSARSVGPEQPLRKDVVGRAVCAATFLAGAARLGRDEAGLKRGRGVADAADLGSLRLPVENGSQQLLPADSHARRRRAGGLSGRGGR